MLRSHPAVRSVRYPGSARRSVARDRAPCRCAVSVGWSPSSWPTPPRSRTGRAQRAAGRRDQLRRHPHAPSTAGRGGATRSPTGFARISLGIEDTDDLVADIEQALGPLWTHAGCRPRAVASLGCDCPHPRRRRLRRTQLRARHLVRFGRQHPAQPRPANVRGGRRSASPRGLVGAHRRAARDAGHHRRPAARGRRSVGHRTGADRRPGRRGELVSLGEGRRRACWPPSTWSSRCCTARTARTAPSRACSSSPGCPYVGAGVLASAAGMDKEFTKKLLAAEGLPIGDQVVLRAAARHAVALEDRERLGLPVFVKPARGGSSIGVSRVTGWDELPAAIAARPQARPEGHRRGRRARPRTGMRRAGVPRRPGRGQHRRRDPGGRRARPRGRLLRLRHQIPR